MKITKIFILLLFTFVAACGNTSDDHKSEKSEQASSSIKYKRYGIKSGIVEYKISGAKTGTEKIIFEDWGAKEVKFQKGRITVAGFNVDEDKITILDGEWTYNIDLKTNKGTKIKTPYIEEMMEAAKTNDLAKIGEDIMTKMGGKIIGKESILGKQCDIWEIKSVGSKSWVWKAINLKTDVNFLGNSITITAVKFDDNPSIPSGSFNIPPGVEISENQGLNSILEKMKSGTKSKKSNLK